MNIIRFLEQVEEQTGKMSRGQLLSLVREMARTWPEEERESFLKRLQTAAEQEETIVPVSMEPEEDPEELQSVLDSLEELNEGELVLYGSLNEEYDDWYDNGDEYLYEDRDGIGDVLKEARAFMHRCCDRQLYRDASLVFQNLLGLTIYLEGEITDYMGEEIFLQETVDILSLFSYEDFVLEGLFASYLASPKEERSEEFYILRRDSGLRLTLEKFLQAAPMELPDWEDFLRDLLSLLQEDNSSTDDSYFKEALTLLPDPREALDAAKKAAAVHPGGLEIALQRLIKSQGKTPEVLSVCREALSLIPAQYQARSRIALLAAETARSLGDDAFAEESLVEAFRSDVTALSYLRAVLETRDGSRLGEELHRIIEEGRGKGQEKPRFDRSADTADRTVVTDTEYPLFTFLEGDILGTMKNAGQNPGGYGWFRSYSENGLPLLLLTLYRGEDLEKMSSALRETAEQARRELSFSGETYSRGLPGGCPSEELPFFWDVFCRWKRLHPLSERETGELLQIAENTVDHMVSHILGQKQRGSYGDCARCVAALGEIRESLGEAGARGAAISRCLTEYKRFRAFQAEMKRYL